MIAAGVNPVAWKLRKGFIKAWPQAFPIIPGWDAAGVVEAVGPSCTRVKVGDEVFAYTRPAWDMGEAHPESAGEKIGGGCCAEYVAVKEWKVAKKPATATFAQAGAIPLAGLTAWQALFTHGGVAEGQTLLILNASGGVGSFAVQFAKAKGVATVIGVCSGGKAAYVTSLGADHVVDYTNKDAGSVAEQARACAGEGGIDACFDAVGGDNTLEGLKALKEGGVCVSIANWGVAKLAEEATYTKGLKGISFLVQPNREELDAIAALVDAGKVRIPELTEMPLDECAAAHTLSESHRVKGKLVLRVAADPEPPPPSAKSTEAAGGGDAPAVAGTWKPDFDRWMEVDPGMKELGRDMAEMTLGNTVVTISDAQLTIAGRDRKDKEFTYTTRGVSGDGTVVTLDVDNAAGRKGVYEITFADADHMVMRLTEPKKDVLALKRAGAGGGEDGGGGGGGDGKKEDCKQQ